MKPITLPPQRGLLIERVLQSLVMGKGSISQAAAYAEGNRSQWAGSTPELYGAMREFLDLETKSPVGAEDTTSQAPGLILPNAAGSDFLGLVAQSSALAKIPGVRTFPPNTNVPAFTAGATAALIGEGAAPPLQKAALATRTMTPRKCGAYTVTTAELSRFASSKTAISSDLARSVALAVDTEALDPNAPYSISNGCTSFNSAGNSLANIDSDLAIAIRDLAGSAPDVDLSNACWIMSVAYATFLATLRGTGGAPAYPGMTAKGGTLLGLPCFTSAALEQGVSPQLGVVLLVNGNDIGTNSNDGIAISTSTNATIEMNDGPTNNSVTPTATQQVSMYQTNSIAIMALRWFAVIRRTTSSVIAIKNCAWV